MRKNFSRHCRPHRCQPDLDEKVTKAKQHLTNPITLISIDLECPFALGMKSGAILDNQISASSENSENEAAIKSRSASPSAWVAQTSDSNPWLQIDLANYYTEITAVEIRKRFGVDQWVKEYSLQYSDNGTSFKYYKEQGQSTKKVT